MSIRPLHLLTLTGLCAALVSGQQYNLNATIGNVTARQNACAGYQLPANASNVDFLGAYQSTVVGTVNFTYHRFGPLSSSGSNNSLVLIPAAGYTSAVWPADLLALLAEEREVITFDMPGLGSSDTTPSDQRTVDSLAASLINFFSAIGLDTPDILGWSFGGTLALWMGAFYADSVGNLVVFDTTSGGKGLTKGVDYNTTAQYRSQGQTIPPAFLFPDSSDGDDALCNFIAYSGIMPGPNITSDQITAQGQLLKSLENNNTLSDALGNITSFVYVGFGELDVVLDTQNAQFLFDEISNVIVAIDAAAGFGSLFQNIVDDLPIVQWLDYYDDYSADYDPYNTDSDSNNSNEDYGISPSSG